MPKYKDLNKINIKPLKRGNYYHIVSAPNPAFVALPLEQFITIIVTILGAAIAATFWISHKITQLEDAITLRDTEINNLKEKVNDVDRRCRYIEEKFMDQSVYMSPEVRREIKEEEEKK